MADQVSAARPINSRGSRSIEIIGSPNSRNGSNRQLARAVLVVAVGRINQHESAEGSSQPRNSLCGGVLKTTRTRNDIDEISSEGLHEISVKSVALIKNRGSPVERAGGLSSETSATVRT